MISLYKYLKEESATPANTMGMGDVVVDNGEGKGTDPIPTAKAKQCSDKKCKKKKKHSEEE